MCDAIRDGVRGMGCAEWGVRDGKQDGTKLGRLWVRCWMWDAGQDAIGIECGV